MENALVSVSDAAQQLGVSRETVKNWGERGILSLTTVGKSTLVTTSSINGVKKSAPRLIGQMQALEGLQEELERQAKSCMEDIREYRLEKVLRKDSAQRVNLYMEIFASLVDLIYDGRYDEREYKAVMMFMKGASIDEITEKLECSKQAVVNYIRKCNEVLFNLQPYVRLQEECKDRGCRLKLLEKDRKILLSMLEAYRNDEIGAVRRLGKEAFELYFTPVRILELSTRTQGVLRSSAMDYLGDLVHYGDRLSCLRGMGEQSVKEVKRLLESKFHLKLGMRIPGWESIRRAYEGEVDDLAVYEELFEMNDEAKEYMETALEELPEERVKTLRSLIQGLYSKGESYKKELGQYKSICDGLRKYVGKLERHLKNNDFFLSPAYEDVKELFKRLEPMRTRKPREVTPEGEVEPAEYAVGLLDCVFSQEAVQAESRRMQEDRVKILKLEREVKRLKTKMELKDKGRERYNEQRRKEDVEREERHVEEKEAMATREAELKSEIRRWKELNEEKTKELIREKEMSSNREKALLKELELRKQKEAEMEAAKPKEPSDNGRITILQKELEWMKKLNAEISEHCTLQVDMSKSREKTLELELKHLKELLEEKERKLSNITINKDALIWYENQVDAFNSQSWYQKLWKKMKKFSDVKKPR